MADLETTHRGMFRQFAGIATATVVMASPLVLPSDPILDLIAEEARLRKAACEAEDAGGDEASAPYIEAANLLCDRIMSTVPQTIAGAVALLKFGALDDGPEDLDDDMLITPERTAKLVIAGLRRLAA